jgi:ATP-dependent DNA helicase RecG
MRWLEWLDLSVDYHNHLKESLANVIISSELMDASFEECILNLVPSYNRKGTKLDVLDWPKKQALTEDEIKLVPSYAEKGTKLLHKKVRYILAILSLTAKPLSLDDIMSAIGYSNKATFRRNYISPLEKLEFITKTNLSNLTAPDQKYKLTAKGALFLGNK